MMTSFTRDTLVKKQFEKLRIAKTVCCETRNVALAACRENDKKAKKKATVCATVALRVLLDRVRQDTSPFSATVTLCSRLRRRRRASVGTMIGFSYKKTMASQGINIQQIVTSYESIKDSHHKNNPLSIHYKTSSIILAALYVNDKSEDIVKLRCFLSSKKTFRLKVLPVGTRGLYPLYGLRASILLQTYGPYSPIPAKKQGN